MALGIRSFKTGFARGNKIKSAISGGVSNIGQGIGTAKRIGKSPARGRFLRVKRKKSLVDAKKFFKKSTKKSIKWAKRRGQLLKRQIVEKSIEAGKKTLSAIKSSVMKKGFNPLKFIMMIFAGWIINQLPKLIEGIKKFIDKIKPLLEGLGKFFEGVWKFMKWIGGGLAKLWTSITGGESKINQEEQKLKQATGKLKGEFKKHEKGQKELVERARVEEAKLKSDFKEFNDEVNEELAAKGEPTTTTSGEDVTPNTTTSSTTTSSQSVKPNDTIIPSTLKTSSRRTQVGTGRPVTVEIKGETIVLQPGTVEYYEFFKPGGTSSKIYHGKIKDMNLVKTPSGPKIVTVEIPMPPSTNNQTQLPISPISSNRGSSDSVNSKNVLLHSVER